VSLAVTVTVSPSVQPRRLQSRNVMLVSANVALKSAVMLSAEAAVSEHPLSSERPWCRSVCRCPTAVRLRENRRLTRRPGSPSVALATHTGPMGMDRLHWRGWPVVALAFLLVGCGPSASAIPSVQPVTAPPLTPSATARVAPTESAVAQPDDPAEMSPVSAPPVGSREATCENAGVGYALAYPADWFVHPADATRNIPACALFAAEPFTYVSSVRPGFGASVYVDEWEGSCLEFDMVDPTPDVLEPVRVGGLPAFRIHFRPPGALEVHSYLVNLSPDVGPVLGGIGVEPCDNSHALSIRSDGHAPGDYEQNRRVVDRIAATLTFDR
jgi:hypothetical protein